MRILSILLLLSFSRGIAMQQSKELSRMWLWPVTGNYTAQQFPTYVTDDIYFKKRASLSGSHSGDTLEIASASRKTSVIIRDKEVLENMEDDVLKRHLRFNVMDNSEGHIHIQGTNTLLEINPASLDITTNPKNKGETNITLFPNEYNIGTWPTYSSYYVDIIDGKKKLLRTSHNPHVIFKDEYDNLHTIQEEKLTVPILGIFGDLFTFLIRYHDVQLTRLEPTGGHAVLKQNPFGWRNAIRTVNAAFLLWVAFVIYSKVNG